MRDPHGRFITAATALSLTRAGLIQCEALTRAVNHSFVALRACGGQIEPAMEDAVERIIGARLTGDEHDFSIARIDLQRALLAYWRERAVA